MRTNIYISGTIGAAIGLATWHPVFSGMPWPMLALLILLPAMWAISVSRMAAFALFFAYYAAFARDVPIAFTQFFPNEWTGWGYGLWLFHAALLALPWMVLWKQEWNARSLGLRVTAAFAVTVLPPVSLLNWGHPLLAAGALYPGTGLIGLVAAAIIAILAALWAIGDSQGRKWVIALLVTSVVVNLVYTTPPPPIGWVAINTEMGRYPIHDFNRNFTWQQDLIRLAGKALDAGAKVVILSEEVAGDWKPSKEYWWKKIGDSAKSNGATVLVGADIRQKTGFLNALYALGQQHGVAAVARIPMPIGNWKPWDSARSAIPDIFGSGITTIAGRNVAISVCFEDWLIWPALAWFSSAPTVLVSVANDWSIAGRDAEWSQFLSIQAKARLSGIPLVRAKNN